MELSDEIKNRIIKENKEWLDNYGENSKEERHKKGQFFTPASLIIKMIEHVDDFSGPFLDPAAGNGGILAALLLCGIEPENIFCNELDEQILELAKGRLNKLSMKLWGREIPTENFSKEDAKTDAAYFGKENFTIITNPPYGRGCPQKKIFKKASEKGLVYSLQPVGSWRTRVGNICELLPLHTSKNEFGIAIMPLAIHTNALEDTVDWDISNIPTCEDLPKVNESLKVKGTNFGGHDPLCNTVNVKQEPLLVNNPSSGERLRNTVNITQEPLGVGSQNHGDHIMCGTHIIQPDDKQPLLCAMVTNHNGKDLMNCAYLQQEIKPNKNIIYFNSKKERTNFIRNIGKIIPLQMLFFSGLFPRPIQRILPPLDREYSTDELLDYFHFPKDVYREFNDMTPEEEYRVSYERWKKVREEKYHLTWEEE